MSFVTNQMFLIANTMTRLNGEYAVQRSNENLLKLASNPMCMPLDQLHIREKELTFGSMNANLQARVAEMIEDNLRKQQKEDIERTFNTFA